MNRRFREILRNRQGQQWDRWKSPNYSSRYHHMSFQNRLQSSVPTLSYGLKNMKVLTNSQNIARNFHLDPHQMTRHHGILPAAYKVHRDDKYRDKKLRKRFKRKSRVQSNRNHQIESKNIGSVHDTNDGEIKKKIIRLQKIEDEVNDMLKTYEKDLGTFVHYTKTSMKDNDNGECDASQLVKTEEIYRKVCAKLRQLVVGFSRPFPRQHNLPWRKNQSNVPFPPSKATKFLEVLESIRKRRSALIAASLKKGDGKTTVESSFLKWFSDQLNGDIIDGKGPWKDDYAEHLDELSAHVSQDCTANVRIYDAVLKSYGQWHDRSNKKEVRSQMESILQSMKDNFDQGNPNVKPDRQIYHRLMKIYQGSGSLGDAKKSVNLLNEMLEISQKEAGEAISCRPTPLTYKIVISCFHGIGSNLDAKTNAISLAEDVLNVMENDCYFKDEAVATVILDEENGLKPHTCDPYHAMLLNLTAAGPKGISDYSDRVDSLVERMMGKAAYKQMLSDDNSLIDTSMIHHLFIHDLIYAFSIVGERTQLDKSKVMLKKMEDTRNAALAEKNSSYISWDPKYPRCNSFNTIITGLLHSTFDADAGAVKGDETNISNSSTFDDAVYATGILDSILARGSSKRDVYSYYRLIRLWGATNSREAGRRGEEILARQEMFMAINGDRKSLKDISLRSKQVALECWSVSAGAGEPGAARSAFKLLNRFDEWIADETNNDEEGRREKRFFYIAVIRACAATCIDADKPEALEIAFEMYNMMLEEDIPPTTYTFVQLLQCCQLVGPSAHDQALKLSKEIFQAACSHGVVNKHVLFLLKQVNFHLFEAYEKKPAHSINVKKASLDE